MVELIGRLWRGEVPLPQAFWRYAVGYGLLLNLITHLVFFALLAKDGAPVLVGLAFALPIPYNLFMIIAVWRSAARYQGPRKWADLAQVGTVIWMVVLTAA